MSKAIDNRLPLSQNDIDNIYKDIFEETESSIKTGSAKAMSNIIFDTLFENMDYPQFYLDHIEGNAHLDDKKGLIWFTYAGHEYEIEVRMVD